LKLENVLVNQNGYLAIIDFGVSKKLDDNDLLSETLCGSAFQMAPEQLNGEKYTKSVDWWAIGIMLYELLFGYNPFNKEDEDLNME
jgi:serine/threonine protein kinase